MGNKQKQSAKGLADLVARKAKPAAYGGLGVATAREKLDSATLVGSQPIGNGQSP
jgi:hypothetical protein